MLRYLAMLSPQAGPGPSLVRKISDSLLSSKPPWHLAIATPGFKLLVNCPNANEVAQPLHGDAGMVLGTLYPHQSDLYDDTPVDPARILGPSADIIHASQGRHLISEYWGDYIAFLFNRRGNSLRVVRAPIGRTACHYLPYQCLGLYFSHIADVATLGIPLPELDNAYIAHQVVSGGFHRMTEPFKGLCSAERGECLESRLDAPHLVPIRHCYWHPSRFAKSTQLIELSDVASGSLRATLKFCTQSLARQHRGILLRLSGGLDSSIILGCLKGMRSSPEVTCCTYHAPGNPADELPWARLASRDSRFAHVEQPLDENSFDLSRSTALPISLTPHSILEFLYREHVERPLARSIGASAIFSGDGGDSGLGKHSVPFCLVQYLQQHGLGKPVFEIARNVALYTQQTAWEVLFKSLRHWLFGSDSTNRREELLSTTHLVNQELVKEFSRQRDYPHRWFAQARSIPWATIHQLGMLLNEEEFSDDAVLHPIMPDIVSPLHSQPVIELLLRTPVHILFDSGRERGLARYAFRHDVPAPILNRQWKDRAPGFQEALVAHHRKHLREILMDGILARNNFLDRNAVETVLSGRVNRSGVVPAEILRHLNTEMWVRNWQAHADSQPACTLASRDGFTSA